MSDENKAPRKRPLRCACGSMRFFVYGDRNDVVCVKCRAVFHVYPLPAEVAALRDQSLGQLISEKRLERAGLGKHQVQR
jgi:hypothetical protein